jgi:hypothetical protein
MNSPLESRKVRLRGLGGPAACGVPGTCASATGRSLKQNRLLSRSKSRVYSVHHRGQPPQLITSLLIKQ